MSRKKLYPPSVAEHQWIETPIGVRDFAVGILAVNGVEYVVTLSADRSGARLTKPDGVQYHVDLAESRCDCGDATYRSRPGGCKHLRSVQAAVAELRGRA